MKKLFIAILLFIINITTTYGFNTVGKMEFGLHANPVININVSSSSLGNKSITVAPALGIHLNYSLAERWQYGFSIDAYAYTLSFVTNEFDGIIRTDASTIYKYKKGVIGFTNTVNYKAANNLYVSGGISLVKHFDIENEIQNRLIGSNGSTVLIINEAQKEYVFKETNSVLKYVNVSTGISKNIVLNNNKNLSNGINIRLSLAPYYNVQYNSITNKPFLINVEPRVVYWF
jgi:hypothetical protein